MSNGWLRIKSDSIFGMWLIHTTADVAMCFNVATQASRKIPAIRGRSSTGPPILP